MFSLSSASAGEAIYVLSAAGTASLDSVIAESPVDGPPRLDPGPAISLQLSDGSLATYSDLVVLAGGHLLLGDGSGRGAVRFDAQGTQVDELFPSDAGKRFPSVVAKGYITPNNPDRFLVGDDTTGMVRIYDRIDDDYPFSYTTTENNRRPDIARAVALPENRIAAGMVWSELSLSGVDVISIESSDEDGVIIRSDDDADAPEAVIIDDLHPLRDLMADLDGRLLLTSDKSVFIVDAQGEVLWRVDMGDHPALNGEFASARWLNSGLVAIATRQPGLWNQPHINHRLHLLDPNAPDEAYLDSSDSFHAAPLRIAPADGQGGTGTRDFYADAFDVDALSPSDLSVEEQPFVTPAEIVHGEQAALSFALANERSSPVWIRRAGFHITDRPCGEIEHPSQLGHPWWSNANDRTVEPGGVWRVEEQPLESGDLHPGQWCGQLVLIDRNGTSHQPGTFVDFQILPDADSESPVTVEELSDFHRSDAGALTDAGEPTQATEIDEEGGCSCANTSPSSTLIGLLCMLMTLIVSRHRRIADRLRGRRDHCPASGPR